MILFASKPRFYKNPHLGEMKDRFILETYLHNPFKKNQVHVAGISFVRQYANAESNDWRHAEDYTIGLRRIFEFGGSHTWYDGPHCAFMLGPILLNWFNPGCKKCSAELDE